MDLIDYLRWEPRTSADPYSAAFEAASERRLTAALSLAGSWRPATAVELRRILEDLPATGVMRIAQAPHLEYQLRAVETSDEGLTSLVRFLFDSVRAELLMAGPGVPGSDASEVWTAVGDCRFIPANASDRGSGTWTVERSPVIGAIPLDLASPYSRGDVRQRFTSSRGYSGDEGAAVVQRIRDGFTIVGNAGPPITRFVETFTRVVVPLAVEDESGRFGSFSSSWYPGRTVLLNVHRSEMTPTDLAAALVHEAIHSLIDVSELSGKLLASTDGGNPPVTSPWTGNVISLQSLLDAYFVWFGLKGFWTRVLASEGAQPDACEWWIAECSRGFRPPFREVVGAHVLPLVHPCSREMIERVRETALAAAPG